MWRGGSLMLSVQQFWSRIPRVMPLHGYTIWVTFSNRVLLFSNADAGLADSYKPTQNTKCLGSLFLLKSLLFTACKIALKFQPKFISDVSNVHSKPKKHGTTSNVKVRSLSSSCQRAPTGSETKTSRNREQNRSAPKRPDKCLLQNGIAAQWEMQWSIGQKKRFYHGKKGIDKTVAYSPRATQRG